MLSRPTVIVLLLDGERELFYDINRHLIRELKLRATVIDVFFTSRAISEISCNPKGVLVADIGLTDKVHKLVLRELVAYVNRGGNLVFSGTFSSFMEMNRFEPLFGRTWGLPWKPGEYRRLTQDLRPTRHERLRGFPQLLKSYSMKAVYIRGIQPEDAVYSPAEESDDDNGSEPPVSRPTVLDQAPIAYVQIGDGSLGYIGDVNSEEGSTWVTLAMFNLR